MRSQAFFDEAQLGRRIVPPAEFVAGSVRILEQFEPPPGTLILAEWVSRLGQDLFYPPNVFGWPGIGRLAVQSIYNRDYPVVQCTVFLAAVMFILINFLIDLLYGALDPRIRAH